MLDKPIIGMTLRDRPQLCLPKQLPEVLPLVKPHPVRKRNSILRQFTIDRLDLPEKPVRTRQCFFKPGREAGWLQLGRYGITVESREGLALLSHHPMPVQIAIRADVHHDFKPKVSVLKCAPDLLP